MSTDLHARAVDQEQRLTDAAADVTAALAAARLARDQRSDVPAAVPRPDWGTSLGARQHHEVATAALDAVRIEQAEARAALAAVANPADAETFEDQLRALLIDEADLRVQVRYADERLAAAEATISALSSLAARVEAELRNAAARTEAGEQRQKVAADLRHALTVAPLDTLVADAAALLGGADVQDASDRLDLLLPAALRTRAEAREAEAVAVVVGAAEALAEADRHAATLDVAGLPTTGAIAVAEQDLADAEAALAAYLGGAAGRLAAAQATLVGVAQPLALSAVQVATITERLTDAEDALIAESELAAALTDLVAAEQAVDDAILDALLADPDADPELDAAVIAARADLDAAAVQDPVIAGRAAYDDAARQALDALEVEVPPDLWDALATFLEARRTLTQLADQGQRDALELALGTAEDAVAAALDDQDVGLRARWHLGVEAADRVGRLAAASRTAAARRLDYLRGDGPAGRTPVER